MTDVGAPPPSSSPQSIDAIPLKHPWRWLAAAAIIVLVGLFLLVDYSPPWLLRGGYTLVGLVTAATIVGLLQRGRIASLLGAPPLRFLGTISYSLYLVHWPVYTVLTSDRVGFDGVLLVALVLAVAVALAWALHVAVERPVRRMDTAPLPTIAAGVGAGVLLTLLSLVAL